MPTVAQATARTKSRIAAKASGSPAPAPTTSGETTPQTQTQTEIDSLVTGNQARAKALGITIPGVTDRSGITSSSGTSRQDESKIGSEIADLSAPAYQSPTIPSYLNDFQAAFKDMYDTEKDSINTSADSGIASTQNAQKNETGSTSVGLARMGGYLGNSGSGTGVLLNLATRHRGEIGKLESLRQQALSAAKKGFVEQNFSLAKAKTDLAKQYESEAYKRRQDFFDNVIKKTTLDNSVENQKRDDARSVLTNIVSNANGQSFSELDAETQEMLAETATSAGYPLGVIKSMLELPKAEAARRDQLIKEAAKKGASSSILQAMASAKTFSEAAGLASPFLMSSKSSDSSDNFDSYVEVPSYDQFVIEFLQTPQGQQKRTEIEARKRMNLTPEAIILEFQNDPSIKSIYNTAAASANKSSPGTGVKFTDAEKKKLEQAGLVGAPRQAQLDHLYGKSGVSDRLEALINPTGT